MRCFIWSKPLLPIESTILRNERVNNRIKIYSSSNRHASHQSHNTIITDINDKIQSIYLYIQSIKVIQLSIPFCW